MQGKFVRLFFIALALLLFLLFVFSDKDFKPSAAKTDFAALQSAQIRFKNLRSFFYEIKDYPNDLQTVYRFKNRVIKRDSLPFLTFAIVLNQRHGEAYIMPEPSPYFSAFDSIALRWEEGGSVFKKSDAEEAYTFAANLYGVLIDNKKIEYFNLYSNSWKPILEDENERKQLKTTLKDYFSLTSKY
jgi:hypothetical protein